MRRKIQSVVERVRDRLALAGLKLRIPRGGPRVRYGDVPFAKGGPLTKLEWLKPHFPDHRLRFNLIYLLSAGRVDFDLVDRAKANGAKVVLNQNGVWHPAVRPTDWAEANEPMRRMTQLADVVLYQSEFSRLGAEKFLGRAPARREILPNALDTEAFRPKVLSRRDGPLILLSTGLVIDDLAWRFFDHLLQALSLLRSIRADWRFRFAGIFRHLDKRTDYRGAALGEMHRLGLDGVVDLSGGFDRAHAPSVFREGDIYLHNKSNDWCPNAVLEAMASGLPVVYSASGGTPELVGEEAGVGIPVELDWQSPRFPDPKAYAAAICRAMDERETMSKAARRLAVEKFDIRRWVGRHRAIFEELISRGGIS